MRITLAFDPVDSIPRAPLLSATRCARQLAALMPAEIEQLSNSRGPCSQPGDEEIIGKVAVRPLLRGLTPFEEMQLLRALLSNGVKNPGNPAKKPRPQDRLSAFDADSLQLSIQLSRAPREVETMLGFVESLMLLEAIYAARHGQAKFEAQIHGFSLR
jgi:hypothetical protein